MQMIRIFMAAVFALSAALLLFALNHPKAAVASPSCGVTSFTSNGVTFKVLFAKNGAVQQYLLAQSSQNQERNHAALLAAEDKYGPEAVDAPPVQVISFKPGAGGMMIPDKAMDSCGRITHFH
jgi:hypothetical protein